MARYNNQLQVDIDIQQDAIWRLMYASRGVYKVFARMQYRPMLIPVRET